jgi:hypothetical protein
MLYEFTTKCGKGLFTFFSPKEISKLYCFDSYDDAGQSVVVETKNVDFKSFSLLY